MHTLIPKNICAACDDRYSVIENSVYLSTAASCVKQYIGANAARSIGAA